MVASLDAHASAPMRAEQRQLGSECFLPWKDTISTTSR
jgi:hypothetical protein